MDVILTAAAFVLVLAFAPEFDGDELQAARASAAATPAAAARQRRARAGDGEVCVMARDGSPSEVSRWGSLSG
jgi:hypothetical protein